MMNMVWYVVVGVLAFLVGAWSQWFYGWVDMLPFVRR